MHLAHQQHSVCVFAGSAYGHDHFDYDMLRSSTQTPQLVVSSAQCMDLCLWYHIHIMLCFCVCRWNMYFSVTCAQVVCQHCSYDVYSVGGVAYKISPLV